MAAKRRRRLTWSSLSNKFHYTKKGSHNPVKSNQTSALQCQDITEPPRAFTPSSTLEQPDPEVVNFLIFLIKAGITKSGIDVLPTGCE